MDERFRLHSTKIDKLSVIERLPVIDARGSFLRIYCREAMREMGVGRPLSQINLSLTREQGSVRGLHFQYPPHAECKIVSCMRGSLYDVAVDLRRGSPTFLHWHAEILSAENYRALLIPEGFAHGFQTLEDDCEVLYLATESYHPAHESALNALDPRLAIPWPLPIARLSERDAGHPLITDAFAGIEL
jgi:dTDP-4-dehydrorhamnose 3,5-epimerase